MMNRALQRQKPQPVASPIRVLSPANNPLYILEIFTCIAEYADDDELCVLLNVCQYFRTVIILQPRLEVRVWKNRFRKLSAKYAELKKNQKNWRALADEEKNHSSSAAAFGSEMMYPTLLPPRPHINV